MKKLNRKCIVCGKRLKIIIKDEKGNYEGGHYFGVLELHPKYKNTGKYVKIGNMKAGIIKGIGKIPKNENGIENDFNDCLK